METFPEINHALYLSLLLKDSYMKIADILIDSL